MKTDKVIIITGESRGLGLATAERLLSNTEYTIIGISRSETDQNRKLSNLFPDRYKRFCFDFSNSRNFPSFYKENIKPLGPIYGFVNNAAMAYDDIITNLNYDKLASMYNLNVFSPMMLTKICLRDMLLNKTKGSIVHVSSISAHTGYKGLSMYASTKGALEAFSKNTAREWGEIGIRSNCVCPGFMETEMSSTLDQKTKDRIYNRTSLKQPVSIDSVAETICFLLSEKASSITGQVFNVDSGTI